MKAKHIA